VTAVATSHSTHLNPRTPQPSDSQLVGMHLSRTQYESIVTHYQHNQDAALQSLPGSIRVSANGATGRKSASLQGTAWKKLMYRCPTSPCRARITESGVEGVREPAVTPSCVERQAADARRRVMTSHILTI
jgi:hypothetical protein